MYDNAQYCQILPHAFPYIDSHNGLDDESIALVNPDESMAVIEISSR